MLKPILRLRATRISTQSFIPHRSCPYELIIINIQASCSMQISLPLSSVANKDNVIGKCQKLFYSETRKQGSETCLWKPGLLRDQSFHSWVRPKSSRAVPKSRRSRSLRFRTTSARRLLCRVSSAALVVYLHVATKIASLI